MKSNPARRFLAAGVCVFFLLSLPAHAAGPRAKTAQGTVEGKVSPDGRIREFLGIPYAAPPIGPLRWRPPLAMAKWRGVRPATSFGHRCYQARSYPDMVFRDSGPSEDCLTLNVWTPARKKRARLSVMVWIYGGGFEAGASSEPRQDGENLAHRGVVVVSMNYRLGIFGFFAHPELEAESPQHAAGNYGLLDQVAALRWVQRNIAAFGGDPGNVTIFGESAGSFSVSALMASPLSKELFARAIGESGGAFDPFGLTFPPVAKSAKQGELFVQNAFGGSSLTSLRALSAGELAGAAQRSALDFAPDVDGLFLPESVPAIYAQGKQAHVPLLAGWNKDEGTAQIVVAPERPTVENLRAMAQKLFGARAGEFLTLYGVKNDGEAVRAAEAFAGDRFIAYSTWAWLEAQTGAGNAPVYRYLFALGSPGDPYHPVSYGAFHSDDIEYVFGTLDARKGAAWRPEDYKLSQLMQAYWTNFARTGNPNAENLPNWPVYDAAGGWQGMHLDANPVAKPGQHRSRYLFLRQFWDR